jgi:hypothetical protein
MTRTFSSVIRPPPIMASSLGINFSILSLYSTTSMTIGRSCESRRRPEPPDASQHGGPVEFLLAQELHNCLVQRFTFEFVGLADVNAHQRPVALESLVHPLAS